MEYLSNKNCKRLTGFSFEDILSLTGIFGIHTKAELHSANYFQADIDGKIVNIEFETDLLEEFIVRIDLSDMSIKNERFISTKKKDRISFPRLVSQVDNATKHGFIRITLDAYGGKRAEKKYNGHIVWGRYGFAMSSRKDRKEFKDTMAKLGRKESSLFELLYASGGADVWKEYGWDWLGELKLSPNSTSMINFNKIRKQKKL